MLAKEEYIDGMMDIHMLVMDGLEAASRDTLRAQDTTIPSLAVSTSVCLGHDYRSDRSAGIGSRNREGGGSFGVNSRAGP